MRQTKIFLIISPLVLLLLCCRQPSTPSPTPHSCEPVMTWENPVEDSISHTFTLAMRVDSVVEADVVFQLTDCGTIIMEKTGTEVLFENIEPLDEGYDVVMRAVWSDTVITRTVRITGFVLAPPSIDPMTAKELQQLINAKDKGLKLGTNEHLSQSVKLTTTHSQEKPTLLREVIRLIDYGTWSSVVVDTVEYDESNQIIAISLHPEGEVILDIEEEVEDEFDEDF